MASPIARTTKVMENDPSLAKGTVRPLAYAGGFDDTHSDTGDEPSIFTPPTQRRETVQAAWLHTITYTPFEMSYPVPRTVTRVPAPSRPDDGLTERCGVPAVRLVVVGATVVDATVDCAAVVGASPLGETVVVTDGDCVVWIAAVVATGREASVVVAVVSRIAPGDAGPVVCAGAPSSIDAPPHATSNTSRAGASRSNRRLTTGLGLANVRLVP